VRVKRLVRRVCIFAGAATLPWIALASAAAAKSPLVAIAGRSVVAVQGSHGATTGFGFGGTGLVMGTSQVGSVGIIRVNGAATTVRPYRRTGDLTAANRGGTGIAPLLLASDGPKDGEVAYLLGSPLGYRGYKVQRTVVHLIRPSRGTELLIAGSLRRSYLGAPLVTSQGRLLGAVAAVGSRSWTLLTLAGVDALISAPPSGGGTPLGALMAATGVVLAVVIGLVVALRRRRRGLSRRHRVEHDATVEAAGVLDGAPGSDRPMQAGLPTQPLVRRREPSQIEDEGDFDVVVKSQGAHE
jgi:hypothetical protein